MGTTVTSSAAPSLQSLGIRSNAQVAPLIAELARELLAAFHFPTGFGGEAGKQPSLSANPLADLLQKPNGYSAAAATAARADLNVNLNVNINVDPGWQLDGVGDKDSDSDYRTAARELQNLVSQTGLSSRQLAGLVTPQKPSDVDKFATGQTCRTGKDNPCNLTNADHVTLAIYDILKGNQEKGVNAAGRPGGMSHEALAKQLEEKYGIKAEVTTVTSREGDVLKALKFPGGQVFCDAAGDGQADLGDYDFEGAVKDIQSRTGMTRESFAAGADEFKAKQERINDVSDKLSAFATEAEKMNKKLSADFEKRWGVPLNLPQYQLPEWLKPFAKATDARDAAKKTDAVAAADTATTPPARTGYGAAIADVYGLFAMAFALALENQAQARDAAAKDADVQRQLQASLQAKVTTRR